MFGASARRAAAALGSMAIVFGSLTSLGVVGAYSASADPIPVEAASVAPAALPSGVTAEKVGWNVVGLDSNRVDVGPNQFPNGTRICNFSLSPVSGHANWTWLDSTHAANIYLDSDDSISWTLAASADGTTPKCQSIYWTVEVLRDKASYNKTRNFSIDVTTTSSPGSHNVVTNQQIYVEKLVSQNRNTVGTITGPGIGAQSSTPVLVGEEYTYTLTGATAPGGYEQVEFAAIFDPSFFEVLEVNEIYGSNTAPASRVPTPNPQMYADACLWDNDPTSPTYRSCLSTGKAGGNMTATFKVRIKGYGTSRLNTLIYDFSGSSYHYNADYGFGPEITTVLPALAVTKTASTSTYAGSGFTYRTTFTIAATNTGDDTLINLAVDDTTSRTGGADVPLTITNCTPTLSGLQLAPGASFSCTYPYDPTPDDVSAGRFTNTATVRAQGQTSGVTVSQAAAVTLAYDPGSTGALLTVDKSASPMVFSSDDTQIVYTFTVTYTKNANTVTLTDPNINAWTSSCNSARNVNTWPYTCTGTHTITQADRDRGYIDNVVTAFATTGSNDNYATDSVRVTSGGYVSSVTLTKAGSPSTYGLSDDTVGYTFTVTNTGDDTLSNLTISDPQLDAPATCVKTTLPPNAGADSATTCTGVHTITQADRDSDNIVNTAKAITTSTTGNIVSASASATVANGTTADPSLALIKTSPNGHFGGAGDVIPYTFTVTNDGDVTVNNITIDDTLLAPARPTCQSTSLAPGESTVCLGSYTVTPADVAAGEVTNYASATGDATRGTDPTADDSLTTPYRFSEITVVKTARDDTVAGVGSATTFDIRIINTGYTTLNNVTLDDTIFRTAGVDTTVPVVCTQTLPYSGLAPGDSFTCTANYTVTQADVDAGGIQNTVLATATDDTGSVDDSSIARVLGPTPAPRLTIDKTAITDSFYSAGDRVDYSFNIRNRGNVTITGVSVQDPMVLPQPIPCTSTTLAPGQSTTCQAYYIVQADDTNLTWLANTATATGTPAIGELPPVEPSTAYVPRVAPPALTMTKVSSDDTFAAADDTYVYFVTVHNSGADTLNSLTISDPLFNDASTFSGFACYNNNTYTAPSTDDTTLSPGEYLYCKKEYTVTQDDMNRGYVENTATAIALTSVGRPLIARDAVVVTGPTNVTTGITVDKTPNFTYFTSVDETITFNFLVKNTGQVTLTNIEVLDGTLDGPATCPNPATLNPDDTFICTGVYTVTALDVANRQVINTASATGVPVRGIQPNAAPSTAVVPSAVPNMTVVKSTSTPIYTATNQTLSYQITVTNTGDDTLTGVSVDDTIIRSGASDDSVILTCTPTAPFNLSPDDSAICTGSYTTVPTDIAVSDDSVTNTVIATGTAQTSGSTVTGTDSVTSSYINAGLTVTKDVDHTSYGTSGHTLTYAIRITNSGDDTLSGVTLDDTVTRTAGASVAGTLGTCAPVALTSGDDTLAPGQHTDCTATYITQSGDDTTGQSVTNTATATGTGQLTGVVVTGDDSVTSTHVAVALGVSKTVNKSAYASADDTLTYTVIIDNTGDDTLTINSIDDTLTRSGASDLGITLSGCSLPITLNADDSIACTGSYTTDDTDTASADDSVVNTVYVTATGQGTGANVSGDDSATSNYVSAGITVAKTADDSAYATADDTLTYTILITNSGDDTLTGVTLDDTVSAASTVAGTITGCTPVSLPGTLTPGQQTTCTAEYVTTADDTTTGDTVTNTAYVRGTAQSTGIPVTDNDSAITPYLAADLTVVKTVDDTAYASADDTLTYTVVITNTGDDTLVNISVDDTLSRTGASDSTLSLGAPCNATIASLSPDDSVTCTGTYLTVLGDLGTGDTVTNTATARGTGQNTGANVSGDDSVTSRYLAAAVSLTKLVDDTVYTSSGTTLSYTVIVENTGDDTLTINSVDDTVTRTGPATGLALGAPCSGAFSLSADDSVTCAATYVTLGDDTIVTNTAIVRATGQSTGAQVSDFDAVTSRYLGASMSVVKSVDDTEYTAAGQTLNYTIVITNTGDDTLSITSLDDTAMRSGSDDTSINLSGCTLSFTLNIDDSITCTGSYTTDDTDLRSADDSVVNFVYVSGTAATSGVTVTGDDSVVSNYNSPVNPAMTVTKSANPTTFTAAGETITYTVTVTNTGDDTITSLTVTDPLVPGLTCTPTTPVATFAPSAVVTCTGTYTTTSGDVTAGSVVNTATATGTPNSGGTLTETGTATVNYNNPTPPVPPGPGPTPPANPAISVSKSGSPSSFTKVGDTVNFTVVATNTGDVALSNVRVTDSMLALTCTPTTPASLAVGASITCTGSYTVTEKDVETGRIVNVATATGTDPSGTPTTGKGSATVPGPTPEPGLDVEKTASPMMFTKAGEKITFTVTATNTGGTTLSDVIVSDPMISLTCSPSTPVTFLAPKATITCTGDYVTTQADVDAGGFTNVATATGTDPSGKKTKGNGSRTVPGGDTASLTVTKSASPTSFAAAGQKITYTVVATNTGTATLSDVTVSDPKVSLTCSPSTPVATLAPDAKVTCTGTYTTTQADVDAGEASNTATATGKDPSGKPTNGSGSTKVPLKNNPGLAVKKSASPTSFTKVGEKITFTIVATNTGDVDLTNVTVSDPKVSLTCNPSTPVSLLAPGEKVTCTGVYTTTQADADAGKVTNTATATGTDPSGKPTKGSGTTTVPGNGAAGLKVTKSASPSSFTKVGEKITFSVVATNTGTQSLTDVTVKDPQVTLACTPSTPVKSLASGAKITCTGTYTTTQADLDAGSITNTATGTAKKPNGDKITDSGTTEVPANTSSSLAVAKTVTPTTFANVGDVLTYSVTVTNTGTTTLSNVTVSDPKVSLTCTPGNPTATLAPAATITCTGSYVATQADIDASTVTNTATATGTDPSGKTVQGDGKAKAGGPVQKPSLYISKTMSPSTFSRVGQKLAVTIIATNVGNVTLTNVRVVDTKATIACSPVTPVPALAPGGVITCTGTYTVTQADMDAGRIDNIGTGAAKDDKDITVRDAAEARVPALAASPSLSLTKSAKPKTAVKGQQVKYTFKVKNTGNVSISKIAIDDPILSKAPSCPTSMLEPGQSMTCTATYKVTKADENRGSILNTASVNGTPARGNLTPATAQTTVDVEVTWIRADKKVTRKGPGKQIVVDNGRTSPNLGTPRYKVSCQPLLGRPRGDIPLCTHVKTPNGVIVQTYGIPCVVKVTVYAPLKSDPKVIVKKKYTFKVR